MQMNPYLIFNGQCEAAFKFYEKALGGKIEAMMTHGDSPMSDKVPAEWRNKIMHARMDIGGQLLMGSDTPAEQFQTPQGFNVTLNITDPAEAERAFSALSEHGTVRMPIQETFWALRFGMFIDKFGIPWMVNCEKPT